MPTFSSVSRDELRALPIGVFDSGVGGLTVLRSLRLALPREQFIYLGDTARLPYGTKSEHSVTRYSLQAAELLVRRGIKYLVIACNTASAAALPVLRRRFSPLPVLGVIEPGAQAGCAATRSGLIVVIGTESTIRGGAYQRAIHALRPDIKVLGRACPLFVAFAEEGWCSGPVVRDVVRHYLGDLFGGASLTPPDTLVLGCTHFPVLRDVIAGVVGADVRLVDSAATTAAALAADICASGLAAERDASGAKIRLLASDGPERFARVGSVFLGEAIDPKSVELVDLSLAEPA